MKQVRLQLLLALALTALFASTACTTALQKNMQTWVGSTESQLLQAWGAPDRTQTLADGSKVDTWVDTWNSSSGQRYQCRKTFSVAPSGEVTKWSFTGCPKHIWEH